MKRAQKRRMLLRALLAVLLAVLMIVEPLSMAFASPRPSLALKTEESETVAVTGVTIEGAGSDLYLEVGDTYTLGATVSPDNASDKGVTWSSDNSGVASVDGGGTVYANAAGSATIYVTTNDGGFSSGRRVVVSEPAPITHSIVFYGCDGGTVGADRDSAVAGDVITCWASPYDDYELIELYAGTGGSTLLSTGSASGSFTMPDADVYISATFSKVVRYYTVSFSSNGHGSAPGSQTVEEGSAAYDPGSLSASGYVFGGWYTDAGCSSPYSFGSAVWSDITLYAKWTEESKPEPTPPAKTYTVSFSANGHGSAPGSQTVTEGDYAWQPSDPSADGYVFGGWYTNASCTNAYSFSTPVTGNITLYARWTKEKEESKETYTVTFDANGHGSAPASQKVKEGETASKPADPSDEDYTFAGWYTDKACTSAYSFSTKVTKNITLYAKWDQHTYTIKFVNSDGTVLQTQKLKKGDMPAYKGKNPTIASSASSTYRYKFKGWSPTIVKVTADATYTATYVKVANVCFVRFSANGHGTPPAAQKHKYGELATEPDPPKVKGFTFGGWYTESTCKNLYDFSQPLTDDVDLFAKWYQEGELDDDEDKNTAVYTVSSGSGARWSIGSLSGLSFTITRSEHNGKISEFFKSVSIDSTVLEPAAYTVSSNPFEVTINAARLEVLKPGTHTLTVRFSDGEASCRFTVTAGAENPYADVSILVPLFMIIVGLGGAAASLTSLLKNLGLDIGYTKAAVLPAGDELVTRHGYAARETHTITWLQDDGSELDTSTVEHGMRPSFASGIPAKPAEGPDAFEFVAWVPELAAATEDATYTASYETVPRTCTVSFEMGGHGVAPEPQTVPYESPAAEPAVPEAEGWVFVGWFADSESAEAYDYATPVVDDLTICAQWVEQPQKTREKVEARTRRTARGASSKRGTTRGKATSSRRHPKPRGRKGGGSGNARRRTR